MNQQPIIAYKGFNADLTCRDFQFEVGKTYQIDNNEPLRLCTNSGFHFCLNFEDVFNYYSWYISRIFKIKTEAKVLTEENNSITKEITILGEVTKQDIDFKKLKTVDAKNFYKIFLEDNEEIIFNKFKNHEDWDIRVAVVNKLSDKKLLFDTFKNDKDEDVRLAVINKLTDEKLLFDTFKYDEDWFVRETVVEKLTDEKLISYFKDDDNWRIRMTVVEKLSDEKLLFEAFKHDDEKDILVAMIVKLSDEQLIYYFKDDDDLDVRKTVEDKLL